MLGEPVAERGEGEGGREGGAARLELAADAVDVAGGVGDAEEELRGLF